MALRTDMLTLWGLRLSAMAAAGIVVLITAFVVIAAWPALRDPGLAALLGDASWHPLDGRFGMLPLLAGSLAVTVGAVALAGPLGIAGAVFLRYYAPKGVAMALRRIVELLAGLPSVIYGLWGLVVLVPLLGHSLLSGCVILALMILPTVTIIADAGLGSLPAHLQRGAAALGLTRWGRIRHVLLPAAHRDLSIAMVLGAARAVGETIAVVMVTGNVVQWPQALSAPLRTVTANIALEMAYASEAHLAVLFLGGLLLLTLVATMVVATGARPRPADA